MTENYLTYVMTEVFMIIFAVIILLRLNMNMGSEYETKIMKKMIYSYLIIVAADIFWALNAAGTIHAGDTVIGVSNCIYWSFQSLGCYYWLLFVESRLHPTFVYSRKLRICITAPIVICCLLNIISIFTEWVFISFSAGNGIGPLFWVVAGIEYIYLIIPAGDSFRCAFRNDSRSQRSEYITYFVCMLIPLAAGAVENLFPNGPIAVLSIFVVILVLFLTIQNKQIYNDALTGLNNRRRMDKYLEERIDDVSEAHPLAIFLMDINGFKSINDNYGHVEGDRALKLVAVALRKAAEKYGAFTARYGGDEFCLIAMLSRHTPEEIENGVHRILEDIQDDLYAENFEYRLSFSIGYAVCTNPKDNEDMLLKKADQLLYERKNEWYREIVSQSE